MPITSKWKGILVASFHTAVCLILEIFLIVKTMYWYWIDLGLNSNLITQPETFFVSVFPLNKEEQEYLRVFLRRSEITHIQLLAVTGIPEIPCSSHYELLKGWSLILTVSWITLKFVS